MIFHKLGGLENFTLACPIIQFFEYYTYYKYIQQFPGNYGFSSIHVYEVDIH